MHSHTAAWGFSQFFFFKVYYGGEILKFFFIYFLICYNDVSVVRLRR